MLQAVRHMESLGCPVQKVSLPDMRLSFDIWSSMMATSGNETFCSLMGGGTEVKPLVQLLKWLVGNPSHTLPAIGLGLGEKFGYATLTLL